MNRISVAEQSFKADNGKWYPISEGFGQLKPVKTVFDGYCELFKAIKLQSEIDQEGFETHKFYEGDSSSYNMTDKIDGKLNRHNPRIEYKLFCKRLKI